MNRYAEAMFFSWRELWRVGWRRHAIRLLILKLLIPRGPAHVSVRVSRRVYHVSPQTDCVVADADWYPPKPDIVVAVPIGDFRESQWPGCDARFSLWRSLLAVLGWPVDLGRCINCVTVSSRLLGVHPVVGRPADLLDALETRYVRNASGRHLGTGGHQAGPSSGSVDRGAGTEAREPQEAAVR